MSASATNYIPKTANQKLYTDALNINTNTLVFALGPAGTGKTLFACKKAIEDLKDEKYKKIVITRPLVTVEEELGFLPGNINSKMDPWIRPIFDIFLENYSKKALDALIQSNKIEIVPLAYMRGRTFKDCFILADEMQNSSPNQFRMLLTRIGHGSRMVVNGDLNQSDRIEHNGLSTFMKQYQAFCEAGGEPTGIAVCKMSHADIERSPIVAKVLEIYAPTTTTTTSFLQLPRTPPKKNDDDAALMPIQNLPKNPTIW